MEWEHSGPEMASNHIVLTEKEKHLVGRPVIIGELQLATPLRLALLSDSAAVHDHLHLIYN